jgi:YD repeat-containing protein
MKVHLPCGSDFPENLIRSSTAPGRLDTRSLQLAIPYTSGAAGNMTAIGSGTSYTYDARNREATGTAAGSTTAFYYNGLDERIEKLRPASARRFAFAPAGKEVTSTRELGYYVYANSMNTNLEETVMIDGNVPIGVAPTGTTNEHPWTTARVYAGHLNEMRRLTDQNLNLYETWNSDAFGVGAANNNPSGLGAIYDDPRFPGRAPTTRTARSGTSPAPTCRPSAAISSPTRSASRAASTRMPTSGAIRRMKLIQGGRMAKTPLQDTSATGNCAKTSLKRLLEITHKAPLTIKKLRDTRTQLVWQQT